MNFILEIFKRKIKEIAQVKMTFHNKKWLIIGCMLSVVLVLLNSCDAKDNSKKNDKKHHDHSRNKTNSHNSNHTTSHSNHSSPHEEPSDIGWSLNNNPNHPQPNPNGYAIQHSGQQGQSIHSNPQNVPQNTQNVQQSAQNLPPSAPTQASGGIGAMGGLALGALGGVAGGYLLSNALNSKSGEKKDEETTTVTISETTLSTLPATIGTTTVVDNLSASSTLDTSQTTLEPKIAPAEDQVTTQLPQTTSKSSITKLCFSIFISSFVVHFIKI